MKMNSRISYSSVIVFLALLALTEGMSLSGPVMNLHCQCTQTESRKTTLQHIQKVEMLPPNSHCSDTEIIATLKKSSHMICLDPNAPWVKRMIKRMLANKQR